MVKAYLRYEHSGSFGVISGAGALAYDPETSLLAAAALEDIAIWNVKQASLVSKLTAAPTAAGRAGAEVTHLATSPAAHLLAAGYSDGTVRLWNVKTGECDVTLSGHRSAVTALRFNASGVQLASGAQDTDIVVWDVVSQAGLFRLRGHHGQVTGLAWLEGGGQLASCGKDGYVKVWDLATQHCSQTVVGHRGEVWGLDVDPAQQRLATGSADAELRLYSIHRPDSTGASTSYETLRPLGGVRRSAPERAAAVAWGGPGGQLLAVQSAGRAVELFRMRSETEARKHMKRRRKRRREKAAKAGDAAAEDAAAGAAADDSEVITAADELEPLQVVRSKHKVRACVFSPAAKRGGLAQLALSLANNTIEVWDVAEDGVTRGAVIEAAGHRSDVRAVALSSDDASLLSASSAAVKVWNPRTGACTATVDTGYGLSLLWAPGNRHAVVGTKEGTLDIVDVGAAERIEAVPAHTGPVWSLAALPDSSGFVSGSADHELKFWEWQLTMGAVHDGSGGGSTPSRRLGIRHTRTLKMTDDVLCVRISPDGKLLAVALLDCTVKVFFLDSLKFFLSLYGHKLPVLAMDISSDSTLLGSGSADKNLKIWGLDFGDCHRSLFAHGDSVMAVAFQPNTHYVFTASKDKLVKYWDADKFEQLLELPGHQGPVWGLAVSHLGDLVVSCGGDRAIRRWERTEEPFFVEEEREARLESLFEADLEDGDVRRDAAPGQQEAAADEGSGAPAARRTQASVSATDAISDALEAAEAEEKRTADHAASGAGDKGLAPNPLMRGMAGGEYVRSAVASVRPGELEAALLCLPFADALRLLPRLASWLASGVQVELGCRVAVLLVRLHRQQLLATPSARRSLLALHARLHDQVRGLKDTIGYNLAAMRHLSRVHKSATAVMGDDEVELRPAKRRRVEGEQEQ